MFNFTPDKQSVERMKMCLQCEYFYKPTKQCMQCSCFMPIKVRLRSQSCPVGKWGPVDNTQEDQQTTFVPVEDESLSYYRDQLGNRHRAHRQSPHHAIISASTTET